MYRIGDYECPRKRMSSDCVYVGKKAVKGPYHNHPQFERKKKSYAAVNFPFDGVTSNNAGHSHKFRVHKNRSVTIYNAVHPDISQIKHAHKYVGRWPNGYVTRNQSDCYPCNYKNPKTGKKEDGAYEHSHNLELETKIINNTNNPDPNAPKHLTPEQIAMGQFGPEVRGCNCRWSGWWSNWYCTGSNCQNSGALCWNNHAVCSERPPDPKDKHPKQPEY